MTKWTKGPHMAEAAPGYGFDVYALNGAQTAWCADGGPVTNLEAEANAKLYAAAPDLYEATGFIDTLVNTERHGVLWCLEGINDDDEKYVVMTGAQIRKLISARKKALGLA